MSNTGQLIFFCGKMGAGKSTTASSIAIERGAILVSEDNWLSKLYPEEIQAFDDYRRYSPRVKLIVAPFVQQLLLKGLCVVLDFPANTVKQRLWFTELLAGLEVEHELVYLRADDDLCLRRLEQRSLDRPERAKFDTKAMFTHVTSFFQPPQPSEGFAIRVIDQY